MKSSFLGFTVKENSENKWFWEELFSDLYIKCANVLFHHSFLMHFEKIMTFHVDLGCFDIDFTSSLHKLDYFWDHILRDGSLNGYITGMKVHMALLNTFD